MRGALVELQSDIIDLEERLQDNRVQIILIALHYSNHGKGFAAAVRDSMTIRIETTTH